MFRLFIGIIMLYLVWTQPLAKGFISIGYFLACLWVSQGILMYQIGWARFREKQAEKQRKLEAEEALRREAAEKLKRKQQESAEKYFELANA